MRFGDDAQASQLPDRMLGGFGFMLAGATQVGHQHHMDKQAMLPAHLPGELADDLDLGHYERFIDEDLNRFSNLTSGRVYQQVLQKERRRR